MTSQTENPKSDGWVLQNETVTNPGRLANQVSAGNPVGSEFSSVLLVGASVRWAAQSAAAGGNRVVGMDLFGDLDTRAACASFHQITAGEQANSQILAQSIARCAAREHAAVIWVGGLQSNDGSTTSPVLRTAELQTLATASGFRFPPTGISPAEHASVESTTDRWLIKKTVSTGGLGVRFLDRNAVHDLPASEYQQRWITGRPYGLVALAERDHTTLIGLSRSVYQRRGDLPFVYAGSRTIWHDDTIPWTNMQRLCDQITRQRGLRGLFNVDWVRDRDDQWWLLEINERPSASCEVLERQIVQNHPDENHASLMRLHINAVRGIDSDHTVTDALRSRSSQPTTQTSTHIKRIVYSRRAGTVRISPLLQSWRRRADRAQREAGTTHIHLADIPADGSCVEPGQPIATVLIDSRSHSEKMSRRLRETVKQVQESVT